MCLFSLGARRLLPGSSTHLSGAQQRRWELGAEGKTPRVDVQEVSSFP